MHDEHRFSVQAFASMDWENNKRTWPCDGGDATTSVGGGAAVLSRCPSYAATSITPALDEATGEVHDECSGDITRGDGDTTRGDGEAKDVSGVIVVTPSGMIGVLTPMDAINGVNWNCLRILREPAELICIALNKKNDTAMNADHLEVMSTLASIQSSARARGFTKTEWGRSVYGGASNPR